MQPSGLPFSRIRIAPDHKPPAIATNEYQEHYRVAYVEPALPPEANGVEGTVRLDAVIGTDGRVLSVVARSGNPVLVPAALDAVQQWVYRPLKVNGIPVEVAAAIDVLIGQPL